ncbi:MAG: efflux RND transporter permease subunit [marine benthic group bacterium]|jgi:HAE1 family hydrophobic/amphiphilic exporter-1|nr:efflux RND transporter permease subunit [Gemmatimonadota bacterium]MCL7982158.1 efflux RND transporter permease subunit [Gemmatimonadota bacterium]MCL7984079.1 efflux RND transporter permease subunit [Gemmatimonadota bacterium]MCL7989797.1 efflux RND transporter permease subunit [Gemmatimonadota bacterium]
MRSIWDLAIRRPVATAMFYLVVVTIGIVGLRYLPVDLLPKIEFPRLAVWVGYPNVGPEEIESIVTNPLENALSGIPNLERMTSSSQEGRSVVRLEFARGTDLDEAANDIRAALDRLRNDLPLEATPPGIWKFDPNAREIVTISATSTRDLEQLTRVLEREIAKRFEQIPGVGSIEIGGGIHREIKVELRRDRLKAAGLTAQDVQRALANENVQLPGGNVKEGLTDRYVRALGEYKSVDEIGSAVVATRNGGVIRVRDVAEVTDGYEDVWRMAELDGVPVVRIGIQKQSGANTVAVAEAIREEAAQINVDRSDIELTVISDQSVFIRQSMSSVQSAALWGGLLAIFVLYLFLRNGSTTFIIALSIPISVIATFGLLYFAGLTLNQMTFGGLALGIGLIVDNAIVVLESIVRKRQQGESLEEAASVGTREVAGAIVAATLTTCVIFLPVVFMRTTSGQLFQTLALVVVFALACSLLVALTLVPMLASRFMTVQPSSEAESGATKSRFERWFERLENWYAGKLEGAISHKYRVMGIATAAVIAAVLALPFVAVELAPQLDTDEIDVEIEMARGINLAVARSYIEELEGIVRPLLPEGEIESVATETWGDNASIEIRLKSADQRTIDPSVLADEIRVAAAGRIPGAEIDVRAQSGLWILRRLFSAGGGDEAIELQLRGYDLDTSAELAAEIKRRVELADGVVGVRVGRREGRPEEIVRFDRERIYDLGLSVQDVGEALQLNVGGGRAGYFREGGDQFPVTVRLRPEDRLTLQDLDAIAVRTPDGEMVPISTLVDRESSRGPTQVSHVDGQRVTYITANLEDGVALGDGISRVREELASLQLPDGFSIVFGGAWKEQQEARRDFLIAIVMALALVYMVMAGQFERFLDPLIVMGAVPVALVGVVPTLLLTGTTLNVQSIMGMVMLIGIVVNNAIVLVDYLNLKRRQEGLPIREAAVEAARLRLRPILMTTLTTVLGLLPLALGLGVGANLQAALARVVIGGLVASTLLTLVLIPTVYVAANLGIERLGAQIRQRIPGGVRQPTG